MSRMLIRLVSPTTHGNHPASMTQTALYLTPRLPKKVVEIKTSNES